MRPFFYVVAGPNGVGKSTASFQYLPNGVEFINSDDIVRQIRGTQTHQEVVQRMTDEEAQRRISQHIQRRESFAVETNLHEEATWQYFLSIQRLDYSFRLLFLCVDDLPILYGRVTSRHLQGGHFVRQDVVRGRYESGLALLNHFFDKPNTLTLIDASDRLEVAYQRVDNAITIRKQMLPAWITIHLTSHFNVVASDATPVSALTSINEVRARYNKSN